MTTDYAFHLLGVALKIIAIGYPLAILVVFAVCLVAATGIGAHYGHALDVWRERD